GPPGGEPMAPESIRWNEDHVVILDQTRLPREERYLEIRDPEAMFEAIQKLRVRGAPAIGVAAAYGLYLGVRDHTGPVDQLLARVEEVAQFLARSRPTAVNLFWVLDRMQARARELAAQHPTAPGPEIGRAAGRERVSSRALDPASRQP